MKSNCLMLTTSLYTGISLDYMFDDEDLRDSGVEFDSHITVFYDKGDKNYGDFKEDIKDILGPLDSESFLDLLKGDNPFPIKDIFELSSFDTPEGPVLILKMKTNNIIYKFLQKINKGLSEKYNIKSDFDSYTPHLTLAYLRKESIGKYLDGGKIDKILNKGLIRFDDFLMSYGYVGETDYTHIAITNYHTLERHFRLDDLKR